jgi:hypothetical protein
MNACSPAHHLALLLFCDQGGGSGGNHGGGGGGSGFLHPSIVTDGVTSSAGAAATAQPTAPASTSDPYYNGVAGRSGINVDGAHGFVVITYYA